MTTLQIEDNCLREEVKNALDPAGRPVPPVPPVHLPLVASARVAALA